MKKIGALYSVFAALTVLMSWEAMAATAQKTKKQSAIQNGTSVRAKVDTTGIFDQECYDAFYGCMDQFCISDTTNGGSCACSDKSLEYEKQLAGIQEKLIEAERVATIEVEKVKAGADADIIFTGTRKYDADGNVLGLDELSDEESKTKKRKDFLAMFDTSYEDEEVFDDDSKSITDLTGDALKKLAEELCLEQVPQSCSSDMNLLRQMYSRQIVSDCKAFENLIAAKSAEADLAMANAETEVRNALKESFDNANKYDLGQCMVEFKKCMRTNDACGSNWENCVSPIAAENMQIGRGTGVNTDNVYEITQSTMDVLNSKRMICERVLDSCIAVRDNVWPAFLREAAPTIRVAESAVESKMRQSCLTNISDCIQKACKDDIVGTGKGTMDACLAYPDMVRSFCKVEIEPCERMEPLIWGYVKDKLAAMRVDACTQEVKDCFTADTRCGANFQYCIGMDYDYIHNICPIDSLVVCKAQKPGFKMEDLDSMLMGLYLNIDNAALDNCQNLIDAKMAEVCGSTTDCNRFAADDTIGAGSIRSQKDGNVYRVTGMISFGSIKMGMASTSVIDDDAKLKPGQIGVADYIETIREKNAGVPDSDKIIANIEEELNNITGTINRTIEMIEMDPEIQYCVKG
ncbi:MAG: hypothetical protein IKV10_02795, partial [Alphaproteobacteria bacterium]|nr:hypothetical protein [Alphaproteobacteria bacterium]